MKGSARSQPSIRCLRPVRPLAPSRSRCCQYLPVLPTLVSAYPIVILLVTAALDAQAATSTRSCGDRKSGRQRTADILKRSSNSRL
ncbi:hypothetical protein BD309DRAFT_954597 [Dichomitus squalens]|nr:hypothetical protein BD309DRAFT_954597 [Dichomitus squalens]